MQNPNAHPCQYIMDGINTSLDKVLYRLTVAPETGGYHDLCRPELEHIASLVSQIPDTEDGDDVVTTLMAHTFTRVFTTYSQMISILFTDIKLLCPKAKLERRELSLEQQEEFENLVLSIWVNNWEKYAKLIDWLCVAFDRLGTNVVSFLERKARYYFSRYVYESYSSPISSIVCRRIEEERQKPCHQIEKKVPTKYAIFSFIELGTDLYKKDIEDNLLGACEAYYEEKASQWANKDTCIEYLLKVECSINAEMDVISFFLPPSSEPRFMKTLKSLFFEQSPEYWLYREDSGCVSLFQENNAQNLALLGRLIEGTPGAVLDIAKLFQKYLVTRGLEFVKEVETSADYEMFLVKLAALHSEYGGHCSKYFHNHRFIHKEYDHVFKRLCNKEIGGVRFHEILVHHFDKMLKEEKTTKLTNEAAGEFLKVLDLSQFILDQQLFITSYERRFNERLIYEMSNHDNEKLLVERLGQLFGHALKRDMMDKIHDIASCKGFLDVENKVGDGIGLKVKTLETDIWKNNLHLSDFTPTDRDMVDCGAAIQDFHKGIHWRNAYQKLSHVYSVGTVYLETKFGNKMVELVVCPLQAAILMLFCEDEAVAYRKMKDLLKIDEKLLISLLASMSSNECKILIKEPADTPLLETDYFIINSSFTPTGNSIKVPRFLEPTPTSTMEVRESFSEDKINSAIVRVLKKCQVSSYVDLFHSCVDELGTDFKVTEFSHRVKCLIQEKYLEDKEGIYTLAP